MSKNIVLKDSGRYSISEIRELVKEFFSLIMCEEFKHLYIRDIEEMESSFNMLLKWLGAKRSIGKYGIGWSEIVKKDVRRRAVVEKKVKAILKRIHTDPKMEEKILKTLWID